MRQKRNHPKPTVGRSRTIAISTLIAIAVAVVLAADTESAAVDRVDREIPRRGALPQPSPTTTTLPVTTPAATTTIATPPAEVRRQAVAVPDPSPGDLRTGVGDTLPVDDEPRVAARQLFDVPYGEHPAQTLDLHLPHTGDAPVVVFVHGGGWVGGDKAAVPDFVARFVERGYAVASVGYRLAPAHPFPAPVHDVKLAIRWIKARADGDEALNGDRLVLIGVSAGGHLAAFTAATVGSYEPTVPAGLAGFDSSVAAVVATVAPTDLVSFHPHDHGWAAPLTEAFVGCAPCSGDELAEASPAHHIHRAVPPAYWAFGAADQLIDVARQGAAIADAWAAAAGPGSSWIDVVEGEGHNLDGAVLNQRYLEAFVDAATRG